MNNMFIVGAIALFVLWLLWAFIKKKPSDDLGIPGKLIWVDQGKNTKPFFNKEFRVLGKPDLMYRIEGGILAVEYKSRNRNIYESDIVQGLTASLAARGEGYAISQLLVRTDNSESYIDLPNLDKDLYNLVSKYVDIVRKAKQGENLPSSPSHFKCFNCAYSISCKKK